MSEKKIVFIVVISLLIVIVLAFLIFGVRVFDRGDCISNNPFTCYKILKIQEKINQANYCQVDQDCFDLQDNCPFGCNVLINNNEKEVIENEIIDLGFKCVYGCVAVGDVECVNNKCVVSDLVE